ncbi:MAG TPA: hypothetical protein PLX89_07405 [Verrucomicrobiota bacterium]|nr:hypothetical protein [Verrucomicrobiota bacterium]
MNISNFPIILVALWALTLPSTCAQETYDTFGTVAKVAYYEQRPNADPNYQHHGFYVTIEGFVEDPITLLYLKLTSDEGKILESPFDFFPLPYLQEFPSDSSLDSEFPDGGYTLDANFRVESNSEESYVYEWSTELFFPPGAYPPTPQISDLAALQSLPTNRVVSLQWSETPGYDPARHSFQVSLVDEQSGEEVEGDALAWSRQDPSALLIPWALTLESLRGRSFRCTVMLEEPVYQDEVKDGNLFFYSAAMRVAATTFSIRFASATPEIRLPTPVIVLPEPGQSGPGEVRFQLTLPPGTLAELQQSSSLSGWTTVTSATTPASGQLTLSAPLLREADVQFYRIKTP